MLIFKAPACDYDGTLTSEDRLGPDALAALRKVREAGLRLRKYADAAVRPEHAFQFRAPDGRPVAPATSLNGFRRIVATADEDVLTYHAGRHDLSRWIRGVFSDPELAAQLRKAERRWSRGEVPDLRRTIDEAIAVRYWSEEL